MYEKQHKHVPEKTDDRKSRNANKTRIPNLVKAIFEIMSRYSSDDVNVGYSSNKPTQFMPPAYTQEIQGFTAIDRNTYQGQNVLQDDLQAKNQHKTLFSANGHNIGTILKHRAYESFDVQQS